MNFRRILFWTHLAAGVLAGLVILMMASTGLLLAYQRQILQWGNRGYRVAAVGQAPLSLAEMIHSIDSEQNIAPSAITLRADPNAAAEFAFERSRIVFVNPYSGEVLGESRKLPAFFEQVENIYRWFGASQQNRSVGRAITGAATLIFLVLVTTGPFLWWPKQWSWGNLKKIVFFRRSLSGRALFWNWHHVFGIWCFVPLLIIVLSGVVMAYPWATNLIYRMTGNNPPVPTLASPPAEKR